MIPLILLEVLETEFSQLKNKNRTNMKNFIICRIYFLINIFKYSILYMCIKLNVVANKSTFELNKR